MAYFKYFPKIYYDVRGNTKQQRLDVVTNIMSRVIIKSNSWKQSDNQPNEFVEAAMRERGFQLTADGHWMGGLRLSGDPENDALLDNFLRHQYREKKEQEQESSSSVAWGAGQVLGGLDGGAKSK